MQKLWRRPLAALLMAALPGMGAVCEEMEIGSEPAEIRVKQKTAFATE